MKNFRSFAILSAFLFFFGASEVLACRCFGRPQSVKGIQTCGYYWGSENIFIGLAEKVEVDNETRRMKVTFSVERAIRGTAEKSIEIFTNANTASCGYPFVHGERYFVYGRKGTDGKFHEGLCGPTTLLKDAEDDLEYAKAIEEGKLGTRIYGRVYDVRQPTAKAERKAVPLAGIEITITNDNRVFRTLTDEKGDYIFKDVPKHTYRVFAKFPKGYRELLLQEGQNERFASACDDVSFRITREGSIRGRVVNFPATAIKNSWDRNEVQQPKVTLIPLDENDTIISSPTYEEKWAFRDKFEYYFDFVPAGRYLLAMNPGNCPYPNNGVRPTFFPGVADQSKAKIVTVAEGEDLLLGDFRSLPLLKKRLFSGVVLNVDKTPAANVTVRLMDKEFPACNGLSVETKTDVSGRFRLQGFEGYRYKISAYAQNSKGQPRPHALPFSLPASDAVNAIQLILDQDY